MSGRAQPVWLGQIILKYAKICSSLLNQVRMSSHVVCSTLNFPSAHLSFKIVPILPSTNSNGVSSTKLPTHSKTTS